MEMEDLEGLTGLKRTKGGSNDTEPAYIISRRNCGRWVACFALLLVAAGLVIWRSDAMLRRLSPRLAARRAELRLNQHSAHARFTRLGQELEQHLESDMHESQVALRLRSRLRSLEKTYRANITQALEAAALGSELFSFEARDEVKPYVDAVADALFDELRSVLEQRILNPMLTSSKIAYERHKELHDQVLAELQRDREEREAFLRKKHNLAGDRDGDGFVEDGNLDGVEEHNWIDEFDDEAEERRDENWRREVVANFIDSFERHFNDTTQLADGMQPRALLQVDSPLFIKLLDMRKRLGLPYQFEPHSNTTAPIITWQEAERELEQLKPELKRARCHDFVPSSPPADDEFDYMQLHNVERYLSDMIWHAKLNDHRTKIENLISSYEDANIPSMQVIEQLEHLEGQAVFPSYWLFHAAGPYDDYRYSDW